MPLILRLDDPRAADPALVGGKAATLARLRQAGFPVLPGCCLTTEALTAFLAGVSPCPDDAAFRWKVEMTILPLEMLSALQAEVAALGAGPAPVLAVRSSAVGEDEGGRAFPGIHDTFLDVDPAWVPRAICRCWASLFSPRALAYRRAHGIDSRPAGGVLIQPMLTDCLSGAAFTCDPLTGSGGRVMVEPSGTGGAAPARALFLRLPGDNGSVELVPIERLEGGTRRGDERWHLAEVARLASRVEAFVGSPQDVEWAWREGGPVILQARPVRGGPGQGARAALWSNGNLKEIFPSPLTPLTRTLLGRGFRRAWEHFYAQIGFRLPPDLEFFGLFGGRLYFNFAALQEILFELYGIDPREENLNMGGHQAAAFRSEGRRTPWSVRLRRPLYLWRTRRQFAALPRRAPRECEEIRGWVLRHRQAGLEQVSDAELIRLFAELEAFSLPKGALHLMASHAAGMIHHLERLARRWLPPERREDINQLLMGLEQVKGAELAQSVRSLATLARTDPRCQAFFTARDWARQDYRSALAGTPFLEALEAFLADFGHRGVEELELASLPWRADPSVLFEAVRQHVQAGEASESVEPASLRRQRREAATRRVLAALSQTGGLTRLGLRRRLFEGVLRDVQTFTGLRELTKHHVVMLQDEVRRFCREAGRRMAAAGTVGSAEDVFFLEAGEVFAWLERRESGAEYRARVAQRRAERERLARLRLPDTIEGDADGGAEPDGGAGGASLRGIPASPGRVRGAARVLPHPAEIHRLSRGDILVVPALEPAWILGLLLAGGVVAEVGGVLSHAAIVARELGVPAVVNVAGVTRALRDGDVIEVDGSRGRVARLAPGSTGKA